MPWIVKDVIQCHVLLLVWIILTYSLVMMKYIVSLFVWIVMSYDESNVYLLVSLVMQFFKMKVI